MKSSGEERRDQLERRLTRKRREFEQRDGVPGLSEGWLPKSELISGVRRSEYYSTI